MQLTLAREDRSIMGLSRDAVISMQLPIQSPVEPLMLFPRDHRRNMDIESWVEGQQLHPNRAELSAAPRPPAKSPPLASTAKDRKVATLPRIRMQSSPRHSVFEPWVDDEEEEERARQYIIEQMSDWFLDDGEEFRGRLEKVRLTSLHTLSSSDLFAFPAPSAPSPRAFFLSFDVLRRLAAKHPSRWFI